MTGMDCPRRLSSSHILFNSAALHSLKRPQLVALSKQFGLKAQGKNVDIVKRLQDWAGENAEAVEAGPNGEERGETWDVGSNNNQDEGEPESPVKSPVPAVGQAFSLASLRALQRTSEAAFLRGLGSPAGTPIRLITTRSRASLAFSSPLKPSGGDDEQLPFPDPDISLSQPCGVYTGPIGRRISSLPKPQPSMLSPGQETQRTQFVFGSPKPKQNNAVEDTGGSIWATLPAAADEVSGDGEAEAQTTKIQTADACTADARGDDAGGPKAGAIEQVWAELNTRAGTLGGTARMGESLSKQSHPVVSEVGRFGSLHDKQFSQMDSIVNHYAAKRKTAAAEQTATSGPGDSEFGPRSKRAKVAIAEPLQKPTAPAPPSEEDKARMRRQLELAKARRRSHGVTAAAAAGPRPSLGAQKSIGLHKRGGLGGFGSRLLKNAVRSVRALTGGNGQAPSSSETTSSSVPAPTSVTAPSGAASGAVQHKSNVNMAASAASIANFAPGGEANKDAGPGWKKFDLKNSLAKYPHWNPSAASAAAKKPIGPAVPVISGPMKLRDVSGASTRVPANCRVASRAASNPRTAAGVPRKTSASRPVGAIAEASSSVGRAGRSGPGGEDENSVALHPADLSAGLGAPPMGHRRPCQLADENSAPHDRAEAGEAADALAAPPAKGVRPEPVASSPFKPARSPVKSTLPKCPVTGGAALRTVSAPFSGLAKAGARPGEGKPAAGFEHASAGGKPRIPPAVIVAKKRVAAAAASTSVSRKPPPHSVRTGSAPPPKTPRKTMSSTGVAVRACGRTPGKLGAAAAAGGATHGDSAAAGGRKAPAKTPSAARIWR